MRRGAARPATAATAVRPRPGLACGPRCRCPPPSSPPSTASTSGTRSPSSRAGPEEDFPIIERADGTTLYDTEGNAYIDGVSSLWCNVHGHRHPRIDVAIKDQLDRVAHSTMLGLIARARGRAGPAPRRPRARRACARVFFSDNGSTACEIALKMAFQFHHQRGEWWRTGFVCLRDSYHGDTLGSVSVGGIELFHSLYRPLLFDAWQRRARRRRRACARCSSRARRPLRGGHRRAARAGRGRHPRAPRGLPARGARAVRRVRRLPDLRRGRDRLRAHGHDVRLRAGGRRRPTSCAWRRGSPAATCRSPRRSPPSASTRASSARHEQFRTFFHGHTYTGNPLACAAALATLRRLRAGAHARAPAAEDRRCSASCSPSTSSRSPRSREVRRRGFMVGIELAGLPARGAHRPPGDARGPRARRDRPAARRHGRADAAALDRSRPSCAGWSRSPRAAIAAARRAPKRPRRGRLSTAAAASAVSAADRRRRRGARMPMTLAATPIGVGSARRASRDLDEAARAPRPARHAAAPPLRPWPAGRAHAAADRG